MATNGPPPKRSDQRRRRNSPAMGDPTRAPALDVTIPEADPEWHPVAAMWFGSLAQSGQSVFYESSDWATAFLLAESISRELKPQSMLIDKGKEGPPLFELVPLPPKAASVAAWLKGMTALLVTDGDRRRAALELQRPAPEGEEADVTHLDDVRLRLRSS